MFCRLQFFFKWTIVESINSGGVFMILWLVTILCSIFTALLLSGKGGFLIAGYNTADAKTKAKYDEKKLCLITGLGLGAITVMMALLAVFQENPPDILLTLFVVVILAACLGILIAGNTLCKRKTISENMPDTATHSPKKGQLKRILYCIVTAAVVFFSCVILFTGHVAVSLKDHNIDIDISYWPDHSVFYEDIASVELLENIDIGRRTNGLGSPKLYGGNFRNKKFGDYLLYAYAKCNSYIVLHTDGKTVVVNDSTPEKTEKLYKQILNKLDAQ